jgi:hypothetical protein
MKFEIFTRKVPWYEITPCKYFTYYDRVTKLYFVILSDATEIQGAGYDKKMAYSRLCREGVKRGIFVPPLDKFVSYDILEQVMSYKVAL